MLLAERRGNAGMAETALSQINTAFETMRDGGNAPSAAFTKHSFLGHALSSRVCAAGEVHQLCLSFLPDGGQCSSGRKQRTSRSHRDLSAGGCGRGTKDIPWKVWSSAPKQIRNAGDWFPRAAQR